MTTNFYFLIQKSYFTTCKKIKYVFNLYQKSGSKDMFIVIIKEQEYTSIYLQFIFNNSLIFFSNKKLINSALVSLLRFSTSLLDSNFPLIIYKNDATVNDYHKRYNEYLG